MKALHFLAFIVAAGVVAAFVGLSSIFTILVLAFVSAFFFQPLIEKLQSKGFSKTLAILFVMFVCFLASISILAVVLPYVVVEAIDFFQSLPLAINQLVGRMQAFLSSRGIDVQLQQQQFTIWLHENSKELSSSLVAWVSGFLRGSFKGVGDIIQRVIGLSLFPMFFYYVLQAWEQMENELKSFIPGRLYPRIMGFYSNCNKILSGYVRGQLMVASILALLYGMGLHFTKMPFGLVIGLLTGVLSLIPYVGFGFGMLSSFLILASNWSGPAQSVAVFAVLGSVQVLESFLITPKIVGNQVGLGPLATILALMIGGNLLGLIGMLIAIPSMAIFTLIYREFKMEYRKSPWFQ